MLLFEVLGSGEVLFFLPKQTVNKPERCNMLFASVRRLLDKSSAFLCLRVNVLSSDHRADDGRQI